MLPAKQKYSSRAYPLFLSDFTCSKESVVNFNDVRDFVMINQVLQRILMGTDVVKNVNKNNASHAVLFEALALVSL